MHDTHCHLDLYPDPYQVAMVTEKVGITTIAVSNLPSAYFNAKSHVRSFRLFKLAIGLHPLLALEHTPQEKRLFQEGICETRFVGEVGLDFSKHGVETKETQIETFKFILGLLQGAKCFVTLHSRRAEAIVLELLSEYEVGPVVFHWYSGPLKTLESITEAGHYFSINPSMIKSKRGTQIIRSITRGRILTETDGPLIKAGNSPVLPSDVRSIHEYLSELWNQDPIDVHNQLDKNFLQCLRLTT